jgi:hypothetical protein
VPLSLEERLRAERHRQFVGRTPELNLFKSAIAAAELPFCVLYLFSPGGVGKTTLLGEFARLCKEAQIQVTYLDARHLEPTPNSFLRALEVAMVPPQQSALQTLADSSDRHVILIDTYETLASLDEWLRQEFLPTLSENTLIVLAGRQSPSAPWRSDPGWQALMHLLPLRNLSPEESRTYLTKRQIPKAQHQAILDFTHGHSLALSMVADVLAQRQDITFQPEGVPDVIKTLLDRFVQEVPSNAHRMALEACASVRLTTEALLAKMLAIPDAHELFNWLRGLTFIESGKLGIFPHDLAREVLIADLRWRNRDWYTELHQRARTYYTTRLGQTQGQQQHRLLFDYIFLHRDNPAVRPSFIWQENKSLTTDTLQETDRDALLEMVSDREGEESAKLAAYWIARQPQGVLVFRDAALSKLAGFIMMLALHHASEEDLQIDPAAAAAWNYLQNHAPLRPGEGATLFRFWMAHDTYQAVSPIQSLIFITFVQHHRNTAGLAFTFFPCAEPDYWTAMFAYADLTRIPEADFTVGGRRYGVYGHDWRVISPAAWQELLAQREVAASALAISPSQVTEPLLVLSQSEFVSAVQDVFRQFSRPNALQNNPLLRSRLLVEQVTGKVSAAEGITMLQTLVKEATESLQSSPRDQKLYRALERTYLNPAPTQEQAAELLDLPFSTYRRHLKSGMTRVAETLWQREIS